MGAEGGNPVVKVGLSTASVYPESTAVAFQLAARLGYDGIEVMVWNDPVSQDATALRRLSDYHGVPVLAVHAPCLAVTQAVWTTDPWEKLRRGRAAAETLGASTVVVHPPFRWQRDYARRFREGLNRMAGETDVRFSVENMFPLRFGATEVSVYSPHWDPVAEDYPHLVLDLSHTAVSRSDPLTVARDMGDRLSHLHLADGNGLPRDEHLVPGRGGQPCAQVLDLLTRRGFAGSVVVEINTRRAANRDARLADLAESLEFTRAHLASAARNG